MIQTASETELSLWYTKLIPNITFLFQLTVTDYNGFVLSVKGEKVVTDVTANDGAWHFICLAWDSYTGIIASYVA